jgi:hypothetical protein
MEQGHTVTTEKAKEKGLKHGRQLRKIRVRVIVQARLDITI